MTWHVWWMFAITEAALTATPGIAVLFVVSRGLRGGSAIALWSALGILAANVVYFAISGTGIGTIMLASDHLFTSIRWAGAAYLFYLGSVALLGPRVPVRSVSTSDQENASARALVLRGFFVQLSNPKALLFFVAILPQFIDPDGPVVTQLLILGVTSVLLEFGILATYGLTAARAQVAMQPRFANVTHRFGGVLLLGAAFGLARLEN